MALIVEASPARSPVRRCRPPRTRGAAGAGRATRFGSCATQGWARKMRGCVHA